MSGLLAELGSGLISTTFGPLLNRLVDLIPDPAERAKQAAALEKEIRDADQAIIMAQNATNLEEAKSDSIFVSGWRPFVGWILAATLAWQLLISQMIAFILNSFGYDPKLPVLDGSYISMLLIPLLGLGVARTYEKSQGITSNSTGH